LISAAIGGRNMDIGTGSGTSGLRFLFRIGLRSDVTELLSTVAGVGSRPGNVNIYDMVAFLLEMGAVPTKIHLEVALRCGNLRLAKLLIEHGAVLSGLHIRLDNTGFGVNPDQEALCTWLDEHSKDVTVDAVDATDGRPCWRLMAWAHDRGIVVEHSFPDDMNDWVRETAAYFKNVLKTWNEPFVIDRETDFGRLRWMRR
jgi:hypothetical protein